MSSSLPENGGTRRDSGRWWQSWLIYRHFLQYHHPYHLHRHHQHHHYHDLCYGCYPQHQHPTLHQQRPTIVSGRFNRNCGVSGVFRFWILLCCCETRKIVAMISDISCKKGALMIVVLSTEDTSCHHFCIQQFINIQGDWHPCYCCCRSDFCQFVSRCNKWWWRCSKWRRQWE